MLGDLRIVEIGEGMAVQVAGLMLAELGADVLKVERPGGDPARGTAPFANWNRGKRSLVLDLDTPEGLAGLTGRLAGADVLLHQFTPKQAEALGLDDASLAASFPRLVTCGITGSPHDHPDVERSADDLLVAARVGALYENDGYRAGHPARRALRPSCPICGRAARHADCPADAGRWAAPVVQVARGPGSNRNPA